MTRRQIRWWIGALLLLPALLPGQLFREAAADLGIEHHVSDATAMAGGVAVFDFDNDGWEDVFLTGGEATDRLYHNQGDGTFLDVTAAMRLTALNVVTTMGVVAGDVDNDGFTDLFVTTTGDYRNYLLRNVGGAYFEDVSLAAGIRETAWSTSATMADYDRDGDLDIYVGNYLSFSAQPFEHHIIAPERDFLYVNGGDGTFALAANPLPAERAGCTLVAAFADYDRDGREDLFVLNDFGDFYEPNKLLRGTTAGGTFLDVSVAAGVNAAINSMGIAAGDVNADGRPDYYVTNIGENILYGSTPGGGFRDLARDYGLQDGTNVSWGTCLTDVDNDGHEDLFFANGDLSFSTVAMENQLWLGAGPDRPFAAASADLALPGRRNKGRGAAAGDLNNDGFPDLVVSNLRVSRAHGASSLVYRNTARGAGAWLTLRLEGTHANRSAVGAWVTAYADGRVQRRRVAAGSSYLSANALRVHFGLGTAARLDSLIVEWPRDGVVSVARNVPTNGHYSWREGEPLRVLRTLTRTLCPRQVLQVGDVRIDRAGVYRSLAAGPERDTLRLVRVREVAGEDNCPEPGPQADGPLVFPNPTTGTITVRTAAASPVSVDIYNASGQRVGWGALPRVPGTAIRQRDWQLAHLPDGVYQVVIRYPDRTSGRRVVLHR